MKKLFGEIRFLKSSQRTALEKLALKRSDPDLLLDPSLLKRAARVVREVDSHLGLIIARDGTVTHVVLGTKNRLYLPDLGRFRLDEARLRRLKLIVLSPSSSLHFGKGSQNFPEISDDLITDLEKLRFDALAVVEVSEKGECDAVSVAHLQPTETSSFQASSRSVTLVGAASISSLDIDYPALLEELESGFKTTRVKGFDVSADNAVLVGAYTSRNKEVQASMDELLELARTADLTVLDTVVQKRKMLDKRTIIGTGKLEEITLHCLDLGADLLVFDQELTPSQLRSITEKTELRVIDRSMLILDIFAQRAKTREGKIQVELAQLRYSLPRLSDKEIGLSRLTGGIGGRGPGETKLEVSKRRARKRIADLEKRIEKIAMQRGLRRERRQSRGVPVIAIVGYTNAGKSTLLNAITKGDVLAESKLFATLDPSSRRMRFPNDKEVVFVDTVGFIRDLPKELVAAFRATLEEVGEADLLLHLVDSNDAGLKKKIDVVQETLSDLGFAKKPRLLVLNKIDLLNPLEVKALLNSFDAIAVSAESRLGLPELISAIQEEMLASFDGNDPGRFTEMSSW